MALTRLAGTSADLEPTVSTAQPSVLPPLSVSPSPDNPAATEACAKVLSALPSQLDGLNQRRIQPATSPYVVAWGDPAVVLRCGVARPPGLAPGSSVQVFNAAPVGSPPVYWLPVHEPKQNIFTTIDRTVYIQVTVPSAYPQPPLAPLGAAISAALPAVCSVPEAGKSAPPATSLCTRRP